MSIKSDRSEYQKQWKAAHQAELTAYAKLYYAEHKEAQNETSRAYYLGNKEAVKARVKRNYKANPESVKLRATAWNKQHPEAKSRINSKWSRSNRDQTRAAWHRRRAKAKGNGGTHTAADIKALYVKQRKRCAACECSIAKGYHVDHVMPISLGGSNGPENLELLCPKCNLQKHNMHPDEWAARIGKLFV